jgi:dynein heavy chain
MSELREETIKNNRIASNENIWEYFVQKCTSNLHVILCMNPNGDVLRNR